MDEQLQNLIIEVCKYESGTVARQKALNRLLILIGQLPNIYRSSHQDYPEAFNRTLEWVSKNIDRFELKTSSSVKNSFVTWFNGYLKWRIRDLYISDSKYDCQRIYPIDSDENTVKDLVENLPDPNFSLSLLDLKIARSQQEKRERKGEAISKYIDRDPEKKLTQTHLKKCIQCNCHLLARRLLLQEPPDKIADLAREFNLNNQTLYSHWKQKCLPLLQEIASSQT